METEKYYEGIEDDHPDDSKITEFMTKSRELFNVIPESRTRLGHLWAQVIRWWRS